MAKVLVIAAVQFGWPVAVFVEVEGEDFSGANTKAKKQVPRSARDDI